MKTAKRKSVKNFISLLLTSCLCVFANFLVREVENPTQAQAENLESDSYIIQFGNFNITSGEKSGGGYSLTDTVGQNFAGPYGEYGTSNYFLGSGFQYIYQIKPFRFVVGSTLIDLGLLTAGAHNTATHDLTITAPSAGGYTIYTYELHPLQTIDGNSIIADTTCDNNDCDQTTAKLWQNPDVGGFGFNIQGDDIPNDFQTINHFRQFADVSAVPTEPMQAIASSSNASFDRQTMITYKAGLFGSEAAGRYQTGIVYIAVPGY